MDAQVYRRREIKSYGSVNGREVFLVKDEFGLELIHVVVDRTFDPFTEIATYWDTSKNRLLADAAGAAAIRLLEVIDINEIATAGRSIHVVDGGKTNVIPLRPDL